MTPAQQQQFETAVDAMNDNTAKAVPEQEGGVQDGGGARPLEPVDSPLGKEVKLKDDFAGIEAGTGGVVLNTEQDEQGNDQYLVDFGDGDPVWIGADDLEGAPAQAGKPKPVPPAGPDAATKYDAEIADIERRRQEEKNKKITNRKGVLEQQQEFENDLKENQEIPGYSKVGAKYNEGSDVVATFRDETSRSFNLAKDEPYMIVTKVIKPAIQENGKLIQAAQLEVGMFESKEAADNWFATIKERDNKALKQLETEIDANYDAELAELAKQEELRRFKSNFEYLNKITTAKLEDDASKLKEQYDFRRNYLLKGTKGDLKFVESKYGKTFEDWIPIQIKWLKENYSHLLHDDRNFEARDYKTLKLLQEKYEGENRINAKYGQPKTTPGAAAAGQGQPAGAPKATVADIERRRQEEINKPLESVKNAKNKGDLIKASEEWIGINPYDDGAVSMGVRSLLMTPGSFEKGKRSFIEENKKIAEIRDKQINAKYDAELKALEQQPTSTQSTEAKDAGQPKTTPGATAAPQPKTGPDAGAKPAPAPFSATELNSKTPEEVADNLAQQAPELADLLSDGKSVMAQLREIKEKSGGVLPGNGAEVPFPYRLYSLYVNSTRKGPEEQGKRQEAIQKFKEQIDAAKKYLLNPPSEVEMEESKARIQKENDEKDAAIRDEQAKLKAINDAVNEIEAN